MRGGGTGGAADLLESVRVLKVARDLHPGSGGREGSGQAHQDDILALCALEQVDLLGRKAIVKCDARECVAHADDGARRRGEQGCSKKTHHPAKCEGRSLRRNTL